MMSIRKLLHCVISYVSVAFCMFSQCSGYLSFVSMYYGNLPSSGPEALHTAYEISLEVISKKYPLIFANYTYVFANATEIGNPCSIPGKEASVNFLARFYQQGVLERGQVIMMAPVCPIPFAPIGDFGKELDILAIACAVPDNSYNDKKRYPTVLSFGNADITAYATALVKLMIRFRWKSIAIINDQLSSNRYAVRSLEQCRAPREFFRNNVVGYDFLEVVADSTRNGWTNALYAASNFSRIILCCTLSLQMRQLLATAKDLGMTSGDYVFMFLYEMQIPFEPPLQVNFNDTLDQKVLEAFESLLIIRSPQFDWDILSNFSTQVLKRRFEYYKAPVNPGNQYNEFLVGGYEAVAALAVVLNEVYQENPGNPKRIIGGADLAKRFFNRTFNLETRPVTMSYGGVRSIEVDIEQFQPEQNKFRGVFFFDDLSQNLALTNVSLRWKLGTVPLDRPICGVLNERCMTTFQKLAIAIPVGVIVLVVLIITVLTRIVVWRHNQQELYAEWWKINAADVTQASYAEPGEGVNGRPQSLDKAQVQEQIIQDQDYDEAVRLLHVGTIGCVMSYLCVLRSRPEQMKQDTRKSFLILLHQIRILRQANICAFLGLCLDTKPVTVFEEFQGKGFLDQLIAGGRLEWNLKLSLLKDLTEGLLYIHNSPLKLHGNLKCSSCLIDGYLGLKIANTGHEPIAAFLSNEGPELRLLKNMHIWMAPEVLRTGVSSQRSDLYSYSIIVHQILEECDPYHLEENAAEIYAFEKVSSGDQPLFRPLFYVDLKDASDNRRRLHNLLVSCWDEEPNHRPTASALRKQIQNITRDEGVPGSLFDAIVKRLELYSETLENTVEERTVQLKLEQAKCDELLAEILPREIVRVLRHGRTVVPEMFECATLFFSDIPEFANFANISSPVEVMAFLHQVYSLFDTTITQFNVYKVETIADSYMVASGLPLRNGDHHAAEICSMALRLQVEMQHVKWSKNAQKIGLRVGIHSGPIVTAVIGKLLPRYCLFGDTVNTASRMESHGEASKIHVSPSAREIAVLFGFQLLERGVMYIKGKGDIKTYWLIAGSKSSSDYAGGKL